MRRSSCSTTRTSTSPCPPSWPPRQPSSPPSLLPLFPLTLLSLIFSSPAFLFFIPSLPLTLLSLSLSFPFHPSLSPYCPPPQFRNAGQACIASNRVLVQRGVYDLFARMVTEEVERRLRCGDGFAAGSSLGPLIDRAAVNKVCVSSVPSRLTAVLYCDAATMPLDESARGGLCEQRRHCPHGREGVRRVERGEGLLLPADRHHRSHLVHGRTHVSLCLSLCLYSTLSLYLSEPVAVPARDIRAGAADAGLRHGGGGHRLGQRHAVAASSLSLCAAFSAYTPLRSCRFGLAGYACTKDLARSGHCIASHYVTTWLFAERGESWRLSRWAWWASTTGRSAWTTRPSEVTLAPLPPFTGPDLT